MSLQPLRISAGRKLAAGLAGIFTMTSLAAGFGLTTLPLLPTGPGEPLSSKLFFVALTVIVAIVFVVVCHLLMRAALGRIRTGGSLTRFFRYKLAALGVGGGLGLGFLPATIGAAPVWWVVSITAGVALTAVSLLAFRSAKYRVLDRPPHLNIGLAEGIVVEHWMSGSSRSPDLAVIRFIDEAGRERWARHLVQQSPSLAGTRGQVQYDRRRPERVLRFAVTHQLFDLRLPREIRENPTSHSRNIIPMPPSRRLPRRP